MLRQSFFDLAKWKGWDHIKGRTKAMGAVHIRHVMGSRGRYKRLGKVYGSIRDGRRHVSNHMRGGLGVKIGGGLFGLRIPRQEALKTMTPEELELELHGHPNITNPYRYCMDEHPKLAEVTAAPHMHCTLVMCLPPPPKDVAGASSSVVATTAGGIAPIASEKNIRTEGLRSTPPLSVPAQWKKLIPSLTEMIESSSSFALMRKAVSVAPIAGDGRDPEPMPMTATSSTLVEFPRSSGSHITVILAAAKAHCYVDLKQSSSSSGSLLLRAQLEQGMRSLYECLQRDSDRDHHYPLHRHDDQYDSDSHHNGTSLSSSSSGPSRAPRKESGEEAAAVAQKKKQDEENVVFVDGVAMTVGRSRPLRRIFDRTSLHEPNSTTTALPGAARPHRHVREVLESLRLKQPQALLLYAPFSLSPPRSLTMRGPPTAAAGASLTQLATARFQRRWKGCSADEALRWYFLNHDPRGPMLERRRGSHDGRRKNGMEMSSVSGGGESVEMGVVVRRALCCHLVVDCVRLRRVVQSESSLVAHDDGESCSLPSALQWRGLLDDARTFHWLQGVGYRAVSDPPAVCLKQLSRWSQPTSETVKREQMQESCSVVSAAARNVAVMGGEQ